MKKIISPILIIFLLLLSFFYTNKSISILKNIDPIMKTIKKSKEKYEINPINAQIIGENIISGKNGKTIDYEQSYNKMKRYGNYNESLTTLKETIPTVSIFNNYNKYIVSGNKINRNISLVFKVEENTNINKILNILKNNKTSATFFIDAKLLETNLSLINQMQEHELEILNYDKKIDKNIFKSSITYLESITNEETAFCYTEEENKELLKICAELKLHTIKPTLLINENYYKTIKENLSNSIIISLTPTIKLENELSSIINYIKSKGYNLVKLKDLVSEKLEEN